MRIAPLLLLAAFIPALTAAELETKPDPAVFAEFSPVKAPPPAGLLLKPGDRLAIIGDSITEQKLYSRILETYLTACMPELKITARQYGWGGETAEGFKGRMANDCLRFEPTIATTCYGMNDHRYTTFDPKNGAWYRENQKAIVEAFKKAGARFVLGSPGCVGPKVPWSKASSEDMNLNLCELRNIDLALAAEEGVVFADVFWPMLTLGWKATNTISPDYAIAGKDAVHPGWAGHVVMAAAFLKALGLDGNLGSLTVDLGSNQATAAGGHDVVSFANGDLTVKSSRYPFCAPPGDLKNDNTLRSGMALSDFNNQFNRFRLVVKNGSAQEYAVTWGGETHTFTAQQLAAGINLVSEFEKTPFDDAFRRVDEAVAKKQAYETKQIKSLFHGEEGAADMEATVALTEKARAPLAAAIASAMVPVTHTVKIQPQP